LEEPVALLYAKTSNELTPELVTAGVAGIAPGSALILSQLDSTYEDLRPGLEMMRRANLPVPARPLIEFRALLGALVR
jgi:hypothetical protein